MAGLNEDEGPDMKFKFNVNLPLNNSRKSLSKSKSPRQVPAHEGFKIQVALMATLDEIMRCAAYCGTRLVASDKQGILYEFNTSSGVSFKIHNGLDEPINIIQGTNDGKALWIGFSHGDLAIFDMEKNIMGDRIRAHPGGVTSIITKANSIWSAGVDFSIKKWNLKGEYLFEYAQHHSAVKSLCIVNEGYGKPMQMWSTSNKSEISQCKVYDNLAEHDIVGEVKVCEGHMLGVLVLCQIGNEKIWSGGEDKTIRVWSLLDMSLLQTMKGHKGPIYSIVEMDLHVWTGSTDSIILVWDVASYELLFSLGEQGGYVKAMVKVGWQLWVIASKNIKVWTAASLWNDSSLKSNTSQEINNLHKELEEARLALEKFKNEASKREEQLLSDLDKQRHQLEDLTKMQEKDGKVVAELAELATLKKQAESNLSKVASQARQCHEKLIRKIVNLEAMMRHSKEEETKLNSDLSNSIAETESLKRLSAVLELEKVPKMKDEYESLLAEKEAEKARLASDAASMREQLERKLAEIEKLKELLSSEKTKLREEASHARENVVREMAQLQERNKRLEDENGKCATKITSLKEALTTKCKAKKEKRIQELENILNDANQLLKKIKEKYYEKSQDLCSKRLNDFNTSQLIHCNQKPTCPKRFQIDKDFCYKEYCSKLKNLCKEENGLDFYNKKLDSFHNSLCYQNMPTNKLKSSFFPMNSLNSKCTYHQNPQLIEKNYNCILKSPLKIQPQTKKYYETSLGPNISEFSRSFCKESQCQPPTKKYYETFLSPNISKFPRSFHKEDQCL